MASFTDDVKVVNRLTGRVHDWELCEVVSYFLTDPGGETVNVPPKFKTDFASVPRPFWFWVAPWGRHGRAAIVHDFLYQLGSITVAPGQLRRPDKREADRIFRQAMAVMDETIIGRSRFWCKFPGPVLEARKGAAALRRWLMWAAVATFASSAYKHQQAKGSAPPLEHEMLVAIAEYLEEEGTPADPAAAPS